MISFIILTFVNKNYFNICNKKKFRKNIKFVNFKWTFRNCWFI